ncbi:MAG: GntR family transcriptional regulator [Lentisphaerota bacterium]
MEFAPTQQRNTLSVRIAENLREDVLKGILEAGRMLPTEAVLCSRFNASRLTIRKSFDLLTNEGLCERIPGRGVLVKVREDATKAVMSCEVFTNFPFDDSNEYYRSILSGLATGSQTYGISLSFRHRDNSKPLRAEEITQPTIVWPGLIGDIASLYHLLNAQKPFVVLSASYDDIELPCVDCNNQEGTEKAIEYLLKAGHRNIGIVAKSQNLCADHVARIAVGRNYLARECKNPAPPVFIPESAWNERAGGQFAEWLKQYSLTALFCMDSEQASWIYKALHDNKIRIPDDISIIAFDDPAISAFLNPTLTSVTQPKFEMGVHAIKKLMEAVRKGVLPSKTDFFSTTLTERNSVKKIPS